MPELPEVETIRRGLEQVLPGREIANVDVRYSGSIKKPTAKEFMAKLPGRRILELGRRGKYLQFFLDDNSVLIIHLRMTGKLIFSHKPLAVDKHTHVIFTFTDQTTLHFNDIRKFGTIYWLPVKRQCEIKGLACLGPEPLSEDFCTDYMAEILAKKKSSIKAVLLNQEFVAGLGNIYADEALFRAKIQPQRAAASITHKEAAALYTAICNVLQEAIDYRGTTMSDYRDATGAYGQFQQLLRGYRRSGKPCLVCGTPIERVVVAGRGTHYCPHCQK
ncbi:MAG: bifunctional DNA-formamidopyrimidine glycosylase/DNA-(apurinic or apyrimidinic site) lyase [Firmicutes bacterium]|nr:bifunctional DNA-formamidopyrimidine glycosylase/DNA-(apurinic or apyrimidinic site) lyase [Bacillota bacterium]